MVIVIFITVIEEEEEEENFYLNNLLFSSAYILKYMIQLVFEGEIRRQNMSVYDIPLWNKINIKWRAWGVIK